MAHTVRDKKKLIDRIRRIRGQAEAIERALEAEKDCHTVLQTVVACRGAISSLMAEIIEGHVREHVLSPGQRMTKEQIEATEELIEVVKTYLK